MHHQITLRSVAQSEEVWEDQFEMSASAYGPVPPGSYLQQRCSSARKSVRDVVALPHAYLLQQADRVSGLTAT